MKTIQNTRKNNAFFSYLTAAHTYLLHNKSVYYFGLFAYSFLLPGSFFTGDDYRSVTLSGVSAIIGMYLILGYMLILPVMIYRNIIPSFSTLLTMFFDSLWPITKFITHLMLLFGIFVLFIYLTFDMNLHYDIVKNMFTQNNAIGFYPFQAGGWAVTDILGGFIFMLPIIYMLEKRTLWSSLKKSIICYFDSFSTVLPLILPLAVYEFFYYLFIPQNNALIQMILLPFNTYVSLLSGIAMYYFYKNVYGILPLNIPGSEKKKRNIQPFLLWSMAILYIIFMELSIILGYELVNHFYSFDPEKNNWLLFYLLFLFPFTALFMSTITKKKLLVLFPLFAFIVFVSSAILFYIYIPAQAVAQEPVKQQFSGDDLLKAVNKKRNDYNIAPMQKNDWACLVAEKEVQKHIESGNGNFNTNQETYDQAIEEVKKKYIDERAYSKDVLPIFLMAYATYGMNLDDTIYDFEMSSSKLLFLDKSYMYGCAVTKDGYGVVVTGEEYPQTQDAEANI